ncbi:MAG: hypothetical protein PHP17_07520 [Candidatus Omnitrophica bacterium]|nr:hypothetical protein [Candidatus Omnitrophota bacterium]
MKKLKNQKKYKLICSWLLISGFVSFACFGDVIETKYFKINLCDNCSPSSFAEKINATALFRFDALSKNGSDINSVIREGIDSLFLEVCDALDIKIQSYRGTIVVFPDIVEVSKIASGDSQIIEAGLPSIYVPSHNTIYISFNDATAGMLAHEMAHAVISTYFVVAPPPKVQEILAGYVEYSVRKKMGVLPQK